MSKTVVIVGALDTKGKEFHFVKDLIEKEGLNTLVVDFGVMGTPDFKADIPREEVARQAGKDLAEFTGGQHKDEAMKTMAAGLKAVVSRLYAEGKVDGILGMGGSGGTSIATTAMRELPVGVPKVMVSTMGGGDVSAYAGAKDIVFIPSIVDVAGINVISQKIYTNGAGAIAGMVKMEQPKASAAKPLVAASMFGNTTKCVDEARSVMEAKGYEVLVFHATGTGGKTMEGLVRDGYFTAMLDITTTELADEVCGGVLSAGPERGQAAPIKGIPTVLVPGCVDMANFGGIDTMPEKYRGRNLYEWNPNVTLLRTNVAENMQMGKMLAEAANAATGPITVILPLKGVSMLDSAGELFWDPQADAACFDTLRKGLRPGIQVIESDFNINDPEFADLCANTLLELMKK